jgi:hypothetical protein
MKFTKSDLHRNVGADYDNDDDSDSEIPNAEIPPHYSLGMNEVPELFSPARTGCMTKIDRDIQRKLGFKPDNGK